MTELNRFPTLRCRQCVPESMEARCRHLAEILDMLCPSQFDLEEGWMMIDIESLELPEDHRSIFGRQLLLSSIVIECARKDRIVFGSRKLFKRADAGFHLHFLSELSEMALRFRRGQAASSTATSN